MPPKISGQKKVCCIVLFAVISIFMDRPSQFYEGTKHIEAAADVGPNSSIKNSTTDDSNINTLEMGTESKQLNYDASAIGLGRRRAFSKHHCIGPRRNKARKNVDIDLYRSCHFTDVCFAPNGHSLSDAADRKRFGFSFLYISKDDSGDSEREIRRNSELLKTIHKPQALGKGPTAGVVYPGHYLIPRVVNESTASLFQKHWSSFPVAIPFTAYQCNNFGHSLGDNVFLMYRMLKNFGLYHSDLQFIPLRIDCPNEDGDGDRCVVLSKVMDPFLKGVGIPFHQTSVFNSYYKASLNISTDQHKQMKRSQSLPLLCFENVLSGVYYYSDHGEDQTMHGGREDKAGSNIFLTGSGDKLWEFRNEYMKRLGMDPNRHLSMKSCEATSELASIIIVPRRPGENRSSGWNEEKLIRELKKTLPGEHITVLDFSIHDVKAQVGLASTAKIVVSMGGGAAYLAWFLPPGASLVMLKRNAKVSDGFIWDNIPYIKREYVNASEAKLVKEEFFDYLQIAKIVESSIKHYQQRYCDG